MDSIIEQSGAFGKFQKTQLLLSICLSSFSGMTFFSTLFTVGNAEFKCYPINDTSEFNSTRFHKTCDIWAEMKQNSNSSSKYKCEFDKTYYDNTIISDFYLVCDYKLYGSLTQTLYILGSFFTFSSGIIGDKYGRRFATVLFTSLCSITMVCNDLLTYDFIGLPLTLMNKFVLLCLSQFLVGFLTRSLYSSAYTLLLELTTNRYHSLFSIIISNGYVLGELIIMFLAYLTKNWRITNFIMTLISCILTIFIILWLSESPLWLIVNRNCDESIKILRSIAKKNKRDLEETQLSEIKKLVSYEIAKRKPSIKDEIFTCFKEFIYPIKNLVKSLIMAYLWISITLLYYGVSMGISTLDPINPYLILTFHSIIESLSYVLCILNNKFGRKYPEIFYLTTGGIVCLVVSLIPQFNGIWYTIAIILITGLGKGLATASLETCFVYTSELYDTNIRSSALNFFSSFGRIGSFFAPQISLLSVLLWKPAPFMIFSFLSFTAALLVLILPDTLKRINVPQG